MLAVMGGFGLFSLGCAELTVAGAAVELSCTSCNTDMDSVNNQLSCAFHSKLVFSPGFQIVYVTLVIYCEEIQLIHLSLVIVVKFPAKGP